MSIDDVGTQNSFIVKDMSNSIDPGVKFRESDKLHWTDKTPFWTKQIHAIDGNTKNFVALP